MKTDLKKFHTDFLKYFALEKGRTQRSVESYEYNFKEFLRWLKSKKLPLNVSSIADYKILTSFMYHFSDRGLNTQTIRQRMLSLKTFCKYLLREDVLQKNPFDRFDIPKKEKRLPRPLPDNIRDKLLSFTKGLYAKTKSERDLQAVLMMEIEFHAGFRKGAIKNLMWENIDFKNGLARVIDKGQKEKCLPLISAVRYWLKVLKVARGVDKGSVFLSPKSKTPISKTSLHDEFKCYLVLAGFKPSVASLHRCRHTFGTDFYNDCGDIKAVQAAMGHEDIGSTLGYVEISKKGLLEKMEKVFKNAK